MRSKIQAIGILLIGIGFSFSLWQWHFGFQQDSETIRYLESQTREQTNLADQMLQVNADLSLQNGKLKQNNATLRNDMGALCGRLTDAIRANADLKTGLLARQAQPPFRHGPQSDAPAADSQGNAELVLLRQQADALKTENDFLLEALKAVSQAPAIPPSIMTPGAAAHSDGPMSEILVTP